MSNNELFGKYAEICQARLDRLYDVQETALFMALRDMCKKGESQANELAEAIARGNGAREQTKRISAMPDVQDYAGVGDGTVADAVTALIGSRELLKRQLSIARQALESISNNTCCGSCREAGLVAKAALDEMQ